MTTISSCADLEGIGEGLGHKVGELMGVLLELFVMYEVGVDEERGGGGDGHHAHLAHQARHEPRPQAHQPSRENVQRVGDVSIVVESLSSRLIW